MSLEYGGFSFAHKRVQRKCARGKDRFALLEAPTGVRLFGPKWESLPWPGGEPTPLVAVGQQRS